MDKTTIIKLNQINHDFYKLEAGSFSQTRQRAWQGWEKWWQTVFLTLTQPFTVVDIGCGNGRLRQYLETHETKNFTYLGIDASEALIKMAKKGQERKNSKFVQANILGSQVQKYLPKDNYELAVLFGVIHHIPSQERRQQLIREIWFTVKPGGWLTMNFWQFGADKKYLNRVIPWSEVGIDAKEVDKGDLLLPWQTSKHRRYCHHFFKAEVDQLVNLPYIKTKRSFYADGQSGRLNLYILLRKGE